MRARRPLILVAALFLGIMSVRADEQLFGFVLGSETLPQNRSEIYQFATLRTGKAEGSYDGFDFETEIEHGVSDKFQVSLSLEQRYIYNQGVNGERDALDNTNAYRFGGINVAAKYNVLSPFDAAFGLAFRVEGGYLFHDEVDGLIEHERYVRPEIDLQKDFLDDRVIWDMGYGVEWAFGKRPAEQYPKELAFEGETGVAYRFVSNWYAGLEIHSRWEYPQFDFDNFEHRVFYAGPTIHYAQKNWWATLTWNYQIYGKGIGELADGKTFAEETRNLFRLKIGFNF